MRVTPVTWALASDWLTIPDASRLSGFAPDLLCFLIGDGGVDAKQDGATWLIEKQSLLDYQECLALVLNWQG